MASEEIIERMVALRTKRKWSQIDLANRAGVSIATIRKIEQERKFKSEIMDKINNALDNAVY